MTGRSTPEWIGKTPDSRVPAHVRARVFDAFGGVCQRTGRKIMSGEKWELDHRIPLEDWTGEGHGNRESNLWPLLYEHHRAKTGQENSQRAKERRKREKHLGIERPKQKLPGSKGSKWKRKIGGRVEPREEE